MRHASAALSVRRCTRPVGRALPGLPHQCRERTSITCLRVAVRLQRCDHNLWSVYSLCPRSWCKTQPQLELRVYGALCCAATTKLSHALFVSRCVPERDIHLRSATRAPHNCSDVADDDFAYLITALARRLCCFYVSAHACTRTRGAAQQSNPCVSQKRSCGYASASLGSARQQYGCAVLLCQCLGATAHVCQRYATYRLSAHAADEGGSCESRLHATRWKRLCDSRP